MNLFWNSEKSHGICFGSPETESFGITKKDLRMSEHCSGLKSFVVSETNRFGDRKIELRRVVRKFRKGRDTKIRHRFENEEKESGTYSENSETESFGKAPENVSDSEKERFRKPGTYFGKNGPEILFSKLFYLFFFRNL